MRKGYTRAEITNNNESIWLGSTTRAKLPVGVFDLVLLMAQVADSIAQGEDVWLSFGTSKSRDALLLTLHVGGQAFTASGSNLQDTLGQVESLL